jgi:hypothetical protein
MKRLTFAVLAVTALLLAGCSNDANKVNHNLTKDAENFKIPREIFFYNGITGKVFLQINGLCSVDYGDVIRVTCKVPGGYKRDAVQKSDNLTVYYNQLDPADVSATHYKFILAPESIIPGVEVR